MTSLNISDLVPVFWRVTVWLAAAALLALVLRRRPASVLHLLWSAALAGALAIPLLSGALPHWSIPVWADMVPSQGAALFRLEVNDRVSATPARIAVAAAPGAAAPADPSGSPSSPSWMRWVAALWLLGALIMCVQTLVGAVAVIRLKRQATPAPEELVSLTSELASGLGVKQRVQVLQLAEETFPMTWGIFRPVILLPNAVVHGDAGRLKATLLHELAHVVRCDFPLHLLVQAASAVYWFHPLVWLARGKALRLRERACDDVVLGRGVQPSDYASSLVRLSRSLSAPRLCGGLGICRPSSLETRVRAILDPAVRRGPLTLTGALATLALAGVLVTAVGAANPILAEIPSLEAPAASNILPALALTPQAAPIPDLAAIETQARNAEAAYDFDKAFGLYQQAAELNKGRSGPSSTQYALALTRLAGLCRAWDRLEDAHVFYAEALSILERNLGSNYAGLAEPLIFLAMEAHSTADAVRAEALYQRVVNLWQQPPRSETALAMQGLAVIAEGRGDVPRALQALDEARIAALEDGWEKALLLKSRSRLLRSLGREDEASLAGAAATSSLSAWLQQVEGARASTAAPTTAPQSYRVGGGVSAPRLISKVEPQYSRGARLLKLEGTVLLKVTIGTDGVAHDVQVLRAPGGGLDVKAVEAVRQWRFEPGSKDGDPVPVAAQVEVNFRLL